MIGFYIYDIYVGLWHSVFKKNLDYIGFDEWLGKSGGRIASHSFYIFLPKTKGVKPQSFPLRRLSWRSAFGYPRLGVVIKYQKMTNLYNLKGLVLKGLGKFLGNRIVCKKWGVVLGLFL